MPPLDAPSEVSDLGLSNIPLNSHAPSEAASVPSDDTLASLEDLEGIELGDGMYGGGGYWERDAVNDFERARGSARGYIRQLYATLSVTPALSDLDLSGPVILGIFYRSGWYDGSNGFWSEQSLTFIDYAGAPQFLPNPLPTSCWVRDLTADGDVEPNPGWDEESDSQSDKAPGNDAPISTPLSLPELAPSLTPASMPPLDAPSEVSDLGLSNIPLNSHAPSEAASVPSDDTLASLEDLEGIELGDGMYGGGGYWERDAVNDFERARGSARGYIRQLYATLSVTPALSDLDLSGPVILGIFYRSGWYDGSNGFWSEQSLTFIDYAGAPQFLPNPLPTSWFGFNPFFENVSQLTHPPPTAGGWIRDLTEEGIEPNPEHPKRDGRAKASRNRGSQSSTSRPIRIQPSQALRESNRNLPPLLGPTPTIPSVPFFEVPFHQETQETSQAQMEPIEGGFLPSPDAISAFRPVSSPRPTAAADLLPNPFAPPLPQLSIFSPPPNRIPLSQLTPRRTVQLSSPPRRPVELRPASAQRSGNYSVRTDTWTNTGSSSSSSFAGAAIPTQSQPSSSVRGLGLVLRLPNGAEPPLVSDYAPEDPLSDDGQSERTTRVLQRALTEEHQSNFSSSSTSHPFAPPQPLDPEASSQSTTLMLGPAEQIQSEIQPENGVVVGSLKEGRSVRLTRKRALPANEPASGTGMEERWLLNIPMLLRSLQRMCTSVPRPKAQGEYPIHVLFDGATDECRVVSGATLQIEPKDGAIEVPDPLKRIPLRQLKPYTLKTTDGQPPTSVPSVVWRRALQKKGYPQSAPLAVYPTSHWLPSVEDREFAIVQPAKDGTGDLEQLIGFFGGKNNLLHLPVGRGDQCLFDVERVLAPA
uniref:Uncharacterized protein n=1 Tax=Chromera velia CCMP2878 TaxID=1169474 RepID=A0A0G4GF66_9ALVE|eukprot:Cvel_21612.t1-p1 / transcript=Cvel_21612.t1 / gene=Cvel_21612 / organism=Chromera_velia_CCMP2878 / gene_product=hypothetical protein / transcript_product=hypothetical protein / location=Cvel_scaffold2042:1492-4668(+) / protein_length=868 / sequence_SO=supercontig / SO=protein_coding / is_pseudo=false